MKLKTYQAETMSDALAQVKRDLGRDAVIVQTRSFRRGGLLGLLGGRTVWEIAACRNDEGEFHVDPAPVREDDAARLDAPRKARAVPPPSPTAALAPSPSPTYNREVSEIRTMVQALLEMHAENEGEELPALLRDARLRLLHQDIADELADTLVAELHAELTGEQLADRACVFALLRERLRARIRTAATDLTPRENERPHVLAFIGPTGVGKTTTIAKLAANFKLRRKRRVGLITIDTYRIAAVDQLKTYAEIIDVPLHVVLTPGELQQAVHALSDRDVVLIDTAGRSQKDQLRLNQLSAFLAAASPDEVHLVLSMTANRTCLSETLREFIPLGANRILLSKLDEAVTYGATLNVCATADVPLSYVTTGQDVPDDIAPADAERLARCILGDEGHGCN